MSHGKAVRLLSTARVHIADVNRVVVDGDTGRRTVTWDDGWTCDCPAFDHRRTCSHVEAVHLLTSPPPATWTPPAISPRRRAA